MPLDGQHLHNRQNGKLVKRHLDVVIVALVQFLQQHGIGESAGTFRSGITIRMRTVPSWPWEALNPCPKAGSGKTGQSGSKPTVRLAAYNQEDSPLQKRSILVAVGNIKF